MGRLHNGRYVKYNKSEEIVVMILVPNISVEHPWLNMDWTAIPKERQ